MIYAQVSVTPFQYLRVNLECSMPSKSITLRAPRRSPDMVRRDKEQNRGEQA